ncbi:hypothetical protein Droror1_Dr00008271 [Drosera rotundifolia]
MCSLSSTHFLSLPRWNTNLRHFGTAYHIKVLDIRLRRWHVPSSSSRNQVIVSVASSEAGDDKGAVPKRTRGRPRKGKIAPQESNSVTLVSGDAIGVTEAASAPIKRGRGRPRKVSPQAQSNIEKKGDDNGAVPKRKRGRPRKGKIAPQESNSVTLVSGDAIGVTEAARAPIKRGRGRPRKVSPQAQSNIEKKGDDKGAVPKRTRGRPRKGKIAPQEINSVTLVSGDAIGVTEAASAPIKRGRGRPRKVSPQAQSNIEKKGDDNGAVPKRKRGRPRKGKIAPQESNSVTLVSGDAIGVTEAARAPIKRGRGRPRKVSPQAQSNIEKKGDDKGAVPKRTRGRPRKGKIAPQESNSVTLVSGDAIGVTEAASAPIKRGRGRPRKVSPQAQSNIEKKGDDNGAVPKRKRGRPRKGKIAPQESNSVTLVSGDAIGVTEAARAPIKRGRGRPRKVSPQAQSNIEKKEEEKIEKEPRRGRKSEVDVNGQGDEVGLNNSAGVGQGITTKSAMASTSVVEQDLWKALGSKDSEVDSVVVTASTFIDEAKIGKRESKDAEVEAIVEEEMKKKSSRRKSKTEDTNVESRATKVVPSNGEGADDVDDDITVQFEKEDEDISTTYGWPPLICCFGAAQHAFLPSGRPANRLPNYEIHRSMKDALWAPEKFFRASGGSAGSVAIAFGGTGAKVAFLGKLGDDDFGEAMLYYLNVSKVQTRSVRIDKRRPTAVSRMKIVKRGNLRISMGKPCAEDSLSKSEINIDVLKEVKPHCYELEVLITFLFFYCIVLHDVSNT